MAVKVITTEPGHSLAPEGPHTVTFHFPGWDAIVPFRKGDPKVFGMLRSIYPRFGPFFEVKQVTTPPPPIPSHQTNPNPPPPHP